MSDIAKCPFCGGDCGLRKESDCAGMNRTVVVECTSCLYRAPLEYQKNEAAAIAAHNRIASLAQLGAEVVEELEMNSGRDYQRNAPYVSEGGFCSMAFAAIDRHRARVGEKGERS